MKKSYLLLISRIFFSLSCVLGLYSIVYAVLPWVFLTAKKYLLIGIFATLSLFFGVYFQNKTVITRREKDRLIKIAHIIFFIYYSIILICQIWFNAYSDRLAGFSLTEHFSRYRLLPFETMTHVLYPYKLSYDINYLLTNLLGNFLIYMPLSYLLPYFFPIMRKTKAFGLTLLATVSFFEITQAFFNLGEFDTDDILFNFFGAFVLYIVCKKKAESSHFLTFFC